MRRKAVLLALFLLSFHTALRSPHVTGSLGVVINEFELNPPGDDYAPGA